MPGPEWDSVQLTEAFVVWTGWGSDIIPRRNDDAVVARFGSRAASELLPQVKLLMDEYYSSDARWVAADLIEMGVMATEEFKVKHSEVNVDVMKALEWCYTFDFK